MNRNNLTAIYFGLTIVHLCVLLFEHQLLHWIVKPMFMPILMVMLHRLSEDRASVFHRLMQFGLFFSWLGDIALMIDRDNPTFFIAGLGSFLMAHLGYTGAFAHSIRSSSSPFSWGKAIGMALPFGLFTAGFFAYMQGGLGEMYVPVLAYTMVISLMGITAAARHGHVAAADFRDILLGAVLFILSDCVIAWNKFVVDFDYDAVLNMSLYLTGQYFLTVGALRFLSER